MVPTSQIRTWWSSYRCDTSKYVRVAFPGDGRTWSLLVAREAAPAFEAFASLMRKHGYLFLESAGGTYNCRQIAGSTAWSLHAFAVAIDLNPSKNPFGSPLRHNFPQAFLADVEGLRTNSGKQVFAWGGRWSTPDAMHFQINCAPTDIATGIQGDDEMSKQDALDALAEFFGASVRVDDPQGQPRKRVYVQGIVDSVWHASHSRLGDKNPAKTLDWLTRPMAELPTPDLQALGKAVADELARRLK